MKKDLTLKDFENKQEARRKYMRTYMKTSREKGHNVKQPSYVKSISKESVDLSFDARALLKMLNKANSLKHAAEKTHIKEVKVFKDAVVKQSKQHFFNVDLIRKYQDSQQMLIVRLQEQQEDIDKLLIKIRKLQNAKLH
tara:strand:+ start:188 stop:604 length:417 start_codon:yes stop_codon:yes gene_type:complete